MLQLVDFRLDLLDVLFKLLDLLLEAFVRLQFHITDTLERAVRAATRTDAEQHAVAAHVFDQILRERQIVVQWLDENLPHELLPFNADRIVQHVGIADEHDRALLRGFLQPAAFRRFGRLRCFFAFFRGRRRIAVGIRRLELARQLDGQILFLAV